MFIGVPELGPAQRAPLDPELTHAMNVVQKALAPIFQQDQDRATASGLEMRRLAAENGMDIVPEPKTLSSLIVDPQTGASRKMRYSNLRAGQVGAAKIQSLLGERRNHGRQRCQGASIGC